MNSYVEKRENFYAPLRNEFWSELYGQEYSLYNHFQLSENEVKEIRLTTKRIGKIYNKFAKFLRENADDNTLKNSLDIPDEALEFVKLKTIEAETVISRVDLVKTANGYKMLEINADTPTFIKELFRINSLICKEFGVKNPNEGYERKLGKAVRKAVFQSLKWLDEKPFIPNIVFTSHAEHKEDRFTSEYLLEISKLEYATYVPLEELTINESGLYDKNMNKIDVLYRQTYPIEHLILDEDSESFKVGQQMLKLVQDKKLSIVNPPSAFLLQSKAVQAAIWQMYENKAFFNEEELKWIEMYMLPTYLDADTFITNSQKYVKKPSFGREGDTIDIFDGTKLIASENERSYEKSLPVFQKYEELPQVTINTSYGRENVFMLMGCFLVDGEPSAMGFRVDTGVITGNMSYFLPISQN